MVCPENGLEVVMRTGWRRGCHRRRHNCPDMFEEPGFVLGMGGVEVVGLGHGQHQLLGYVVLGQLLVFLRPLLQVGGLGLGRNLGLLLLR